MPHKEGKLHWIDLNSSPVKIVVSILFIIGDWKGSYYGKGILKLVSDIPNGSPICCPCKVVATINESVRV